MNASTYFKIITPVYNTSKYLDKCIKSVLNQTFKDWFWILVDDLSTDGSYEKLLEYEKQYPDHIKVIRAPYKSYAGGARNIAHAFKIDTAYDYYIDSDDWLADENVFQRVYSIIQKNNSPDLIISSYKTTIGNSKIFNINNINDLLRSNIEAQPWKFYVKHSLNNDFANYYTIEDNYWFINLCMKLNSVVSTNYIDYIYNVNSETGISTHAMGLQKNRSIVFLSFLNFALDASRLNIGNNSLLKTKVSWFIHTYDRYVNSLEIDKFKHLNFNYLIDNACLIGDSILNNYDFNIVNIKINVIDAIKIARAHDLPYVLILNQTINPCIDIIRRLQLFTSYIPDNADILVLGFKNAIGNNKIFNKINNVSNINGINGYIVFKTSYNAIIDLLLQGKTIENILNNSFNSYIINESLF